MSEPTTAELVERVRGEIERNRHCDCPRGMVYHAGNCPFHPDAYNGHAALNALAARVEELERTLRLADDLICHHLVDPHVQTTSTYLDGAVEEIRRALGGEQE